VRPPVSRDGPSGARGDERRGTRARAAAQTRPPAAEDSSAITTHTQSRVQEPLEPQPTPRPRHVPVPLLVSPPPDRLLRVASTVPSLRSRTSSPAHPICLTPIPAAAPPEATPASRLGWPVQVLPGQSRKGSPARSGGLPFLQSPGGKPRKHPKAGRRPVALMGETHRAKQMEGNTRRETGVPPTSTPFPGASLGRLDSLHEPMGGRSRSGGRPGARSAI
jgi:hypothetical protein